MNIAVYCGSASGNRPSFTEGAKALGSWIAQNGHTLVYGGSRTGLMGATADAVLAGGGKVIGVIPDVKLIQERRHPGLTECIETKDMAERKQKMIEGYYQALKKIFEEMVEVGFSEKEDFKRVLVSADLDEIERFIEQ